MLYFWLIWFDRGQSSHANNFNATHMNGGWGHNRVGMSSSAGAATVPSASWL